MKKFLFTLTALLMAGTAFAGRIYIPDTEFTTDQLGTQVFLPVYIELDNEYINGWNVEFTYPENLTVTGGIKKNAAVLTQTAVTDEFGGTENVSFTVNGNSTANTGFCAQQGFWNPDGNGYVPYGAVKIGPTGTFMLYEIQVTPPADFTEGYITMRWMYSGGADTRNGQGAISSGDPAVDNGMTTTRVHLYVKQDNPAPPAEITSEGNVVTANVDGEEFGTHTVELYIVTLDDEGNVVSRTPVENPYTVTQTDEDQEIYFVAVTKANDGETEDTETTPTKIVIPAKPVPLAVTLDPDEDSAITGQEIAVTVEANKEGATFSYAVEPATGATVTETEDGFKITATEAGTYKVTVTATLGDETATAEGTYTFVEPLAVTLDPDEANAKVGQEIAVTVEANKEGATFSYACEGATVTETEDGFEITATAAGTYTVTVTATVGEETATATGTYTFVEPLAVTLDPDEANAKVGQEIAVTVEANKDGATFNYACEGATVTETEDGFKITAAEAGTYKVTVTATLGDETATAEGTYTFSAITYAPEPTIALINENTKVKATAPEGYDVVMMLEGTECANPYTLPDASTEQETVLNFSAYTVKKTEDNNSEPVPYTVTIAIKPTITFTEVANGVKVTILNYTEYTIKVNGTTVDYRAGTGELVVEKGDEVKVIDVYAKNAPEGRVPAEATDQYTLAAKTVYNTPDPVIGTPTVNDNDVTFTVTGEGTVTVTVTYNDGTTETFTGTDEVEVTIPRTDQDVTVTVNATAKSNKEGYDVINEGTAGPTTVSVPAMQTAAPTIDVSFDEVDGKTIAYVTFKNNDENAAVIEYSTDNGETWNEYNPAVPVTFTATDENQEITVWARAKADGKAMSEVEKRSFELNNTATSVNELVNGKTVAGVRYFNMAGQEMQEANGITIVVTTYTDGTTSAVKVVK